MKFSVIIPTLNRIGFLKKAIESVKNQTYKNFELIVIDNGSTDGTLEYLESLDIDIKYFSIAKTGLISISRNYGIENSTGDWITFLDDDDIWYKDKLEKLHTYINKNKDIDLICHSELHTNVEGTIKKIVNYGRNKYLNLDSFLLTGNKLSTSSTSIKKDTVLKYNLFFNTKPEFNSVEDYELWIRCCKSNLNMKTVDFIGGEYLLHENNISSKTFMHYNNQKNVVNLHSEHFSELKKVIAFARIDLRISYELFRNKKFIRALYSLNFFSIPWIFYYICKWNK